MEEIDSCASVTLDESHLNVFFFFCRVLPQVADLIQAHDKRYRWLQEQGVMRYLHPTFFFMNSDTMTVLLLVVFLVTQVLLQLTFKGHFKYLVPHLPEFVQNMFK